MNTNEKGIKYCACGHRKELHKPRCYVCGCVVYHREAKEQREKISSRDNISYPKYGEI